MTNIKRMAYSLWAKKNVQDGQPMWLPLIVHLMDTKNVIGWLYNHWIDDGQREVMRENFDSEEELLKFVKFLAPFMTLERQLLHFRPRNHISGMMNLTTIWS